MQSSDLPPTAVKFFDFYAMYELYLRVGGFRNHGYDRYPVYVNEHIWNRIVGKYEDVVDEFYSMVKAALVDSLQSEVRHFPKRCHYYRYGDEPAFYDNIANKTGVTPAMIDAVKKDVEKYPHAVHAIFYVPKWHISYGGRKWAKAAKMLIDSKEVKTHHDKVFWCDRVLDLQHNTGHLLNKTSFECLSRLCIEIPGKTPGAPKARHKPLNFRARARSITKFIPYTSPAVAKLVIPRLRLLDPTFA
jgi:hypothetical protein